MIQFWGGFSSEEYMALCLPPCLYIAVSLQQTNKKMIAVSSSEGR